MHMSLPEVALLVVSACQLSCAIPGSVRSCVGVFCLSRSLCFSEIVGRCGILVRRHWTMAGVEVRSCGRHRCPHCSELVLADCLLHVCRQCGRAVGLCCQHRPCPYRHLSQYVTVPASCVGRVDTQRRPLAASASGALTAGAPDVAVRLGCAVAVCGLCGRPAVGTNGLRALARNGQVLSACGVCWAFENLRALAPDLHYADWVSLHDGLVALHVACRAAADCMSDSTVVAGGGPNQCHGHGGVVSEGETSPPHEQTRCSRSRVRSRSRKGPRWNVSHC